MYANHHLKSQEEVARVRRKAVCLDKGIHRADKSEVLTYRPLLITVIKWCKIYFFTVHTGIPGWGARLV